MLQLKNITKTYQTGELFQTALSEVSVNFRESEFVAVLGQSGSGKTTLLNIIGGLDRYDSGDLIINEKSTKEYKDSNWDTYRNHSIGFIFQSYNLIPHQTVLSNVELALTLSGVSKTERRLRAKEVLEKVGLGDQLHKKPNQMSGGQMQRVAIARALVNNPDILLADEPTGALDSETSTQVIDLLKEISEDRLIIMVTHNPEIAEEYANRIIHLKDGKITADSNPFNDEELAQAEKKAAPAAAQTSPKAKGKTSMSFLTALSLSLNNLLTKKGRTILTSFAGSIGIIGIALILSLSSGFQIYIDSVQEETLSSYPLAIESSSVNLGALLSMTPMDPAEKVEGQEEGKVYTNSAIGDMLNSFSKEAWNNNLADFKTYLDEGREGLAKYINSIDYTYDVGLNIYSPDTSNGVRQLNPSPLAELMSGSVNSPLFASSVASQYDMWKPLMDNQDFLESQYDVLAGKWPQSFNEVVLMIGANNQITELTLQALGITDATAMLKAFQSGESYTGKSVELTYEEILNMSFKLILQPDYYALNNETGTWADMSGDEAYLKELVNKGTELKVVGVVRPNEQSIANASAAGTIGYLKTLTEYAINEINSREVVKLQQQNKDFDVFVGLPFEVAKEEEVVAKPEESTTMPATTGTPTAATGKPFATPTVGNLAMKDAAPAASFIEETAAPGKTMTEDEVYAYIDANFKGDEKTKMTEFAKLFLKPLRNAAERQKLINLLDEMLKGQTFEGMENITGQQAYGYINLMDKNAKLEMLTKIIEADKAGITPVTPEPTKPQPTKPGTTDPAQPEPPVEEEPVIPEPVLPTVSESSYKENAALLGVADLARPSVINIYPKNFEAKDNIEKFIEDYNAKMTAEGKAENTIEYTDYIGLIMSSVTKIINIVSYVLIAFVSISLVVSSIMIGIITYISVLERTKEIGILRSIGASKRDISTVFNAETLIVGLTAGVIGIGLTLLLNIPVNMIIKRLTDIPNVAILPMFGALGLIAISMVLTTLAGLIPSGMAANKDPVVALRSE